MKQRKLSRLLAVVLSVVMLAIPATSVNAAAFSDTEGHWAEEYIDALAAEDIVSGYGTSGAFAPDRNVTRAEAAKMFAEAANTPSASGTKFTDLLGDWSDPYIMSLEKAGIVSGVAGSDLFKPKDNIKRSAVAKMAVEAWDITEGDVDVAFNDISHLAEEDQEYINILASNGIVKGYGTSGAFAPDRYVTRAELAKIIYESMNWEPVDNTFRVVDVRAINANKLEVTFSQKVHKADAESPSKYNSVGRGLPSTAANYELQSDEKTVVITLNNATANGTTFVITVEPIKAKDPDTALTPRFSKTLTFSDTVRPAVEEVNYPAFGFAEIVFTEELSEIGTVDVTVPAAHDASTSTFAQVAFVVGDNKLAFTGLQKDLEYEVTIVGAKDRSGNLITPNPTTVVLKNTLTEDKVQPTLVSATALSNSKIEFKFSKELSAADALKIKYNNAALVGTAVVKATDKTVAVVELTTANTLAAAPFTFEAGAVTDTSTALNKNAAFTELVRFNIDATGPVLTKQEVKAGSPNELHLTFNEEIANTLSGTLTFKYVDEYGVDKAETVAAPSLLSTDSKVAVIKLENTSSAVLSDKYNYTVEFAKGYFEDGFGNDSALFSVQVVNTATPSSSKLTLATTDPIKEKSAGVIEVKFADGVNAAQAKTLSNYVVEGFTVEKVTLTANSATAATVEVKLADNAVKIGGLYNVTVKGISGYEAGVTTMDPVTKAINLTENVRPTVLSAKAIEFGTSSEIELTFSENVTATGGDYFELYISGVKQNVKGSLAAISTAANKGTVTVNVNLAADIAAGKVVTLEFDGTNTIKDVKNNAIVEGSITVK